MKSIHRYICIGGTTRIYCIRATTPDQIYVNIQGKWVDPLPKYGCPKRSIFPCECTKGSDEGIYLECSNTNIASLSVGLQQVKTLIHTLIINNCNIEKLYGNLFKPLTIRILKIFDTPIKDISDGTFDQLSVSLEELHIKNSLLTRLSPSIKNLTSLKILFIENSQISYLPEGVLNGLNSLKELSISHGNIKSIGKKLSSLPRDAFKSQGQLEFLDISHNHFSKLEPHYFPNLRKLLWLNISHNEIPRIQSRVFARNSLLRVLHLNANKIDRLDTNSLRGMRFLRRLYLSDNFIPSVGRGAFRAVSRIGTVDLARNNLTKVDYQLFSDLRFIDTISLQQNQIKNIDKEAFTNLYLTKINISHNQIPFLGSGLFKNCENMTFLDLSHNQIVHIAEDAFNENTYATEFLLQYNKLTSMSGVPLTYQKGLKVLNVSHNEIVDIPKNTFPKLYEVFRLDFSHNNISIIGKSVFSTLLSLRHIDLSHNSLTKLDSGMLGKVPTLLDIDLSYNKLNRVRRSVFGGLSSIRFVKLHHNELNEVPAPPISLNAMDCSYNNIKEIKGRQPWPVMNSLLELNLDYNQLGDSLEAGRFDALRSLRSVNYIDLDDNHIRNLSRNAFGRLPILFELGLSNNSINNISVEAFGGLLQLQKLDLSQNNITYIPPGAFKGMSALYDINLSFNKIKHLQNRTHGLFEDTLSIRKIDLSHNQIPFITPKMFPESRWAPYRLNHVDLSHNLMPVLTKSILKGTKYLNYLNISYNMLNAVREGILTNLTSLKVFDISGNKLKDDIFNNGSFGNMPNLTVFNLYDNEFESLPVEDLLLQSNLKVLDIRMDIYYGGNPLMCDCSLRPVCILAQILASILEERLVCADSLDALKFKLNPDIQFREIKEDRGLIKLSWFVTTNEDVGDFRLEIRNSDFPPQTIATEDVDYGSRYTIIKNEFNEPSDKLKICLLAKNSAGRIRRWRQDHIKITRRFRLISQTAASRNDFIFLVNFYQTHMAGPK
ncbi:unnamed protein product [Lepeophtheirus salmonis]|uniref:(salmon louse) hypothetical protein n=1 Tax=Lepeophtheirus salmonis TaxID=72036 RepID=A0A7R8CY12_LEPSM|nr:unnamed protein product [Lepeophtheirus salmonis]CAF2966299.1 unnamed protein product [Lepeophtheirus salmonis]